MVCAPAQFWRDGGVRRVDLSECGLIAEAGDRMAGAKGATDADAGSGSNSVVSGS